MFRSSRKVKPQGQYNDLSSSSDSEGISSLAYVLRGSKKSKISRIFDNKEIEFIEKRFNDTARVIFQESENHEFLDNCKQEVDEMNRLLLRNSYKAVFRSDLVAIGGRNVGSSTHNGPPQSRVRTQQNKPPQSRVRTQQNKPPPIQHVQTIDEIWDSKINTNSTSGHKNNLHNNTVSPEVRSSRNHTRKGICTVT